MVLLRRRALRSYDDLEVLVGHGEGHVDEEVVHAVPWCELRAVVVGQVRVALVHDVYAHLTRGGVVE